MWVFPFVVFPSPHFFFCHLLRVFAVICFTFVIVLVAAVVGIAFVHWISKWAAGGGAAAGLRLATSAPTRSSIVNCFLLNKCEGIGQSQAGGKGYVQVRVYVCECVCVVANSFCSSSSWLFASLKCKNSKQEKLKLCVKVFPWQVNEVRLHNKVSYS